jgi:hypothetical protein
MRKVADISPWSADVAAATAPPPEEPSESPRHFAASMDESVIVGYYTLKKCLSVTPRCLQIPKKGEKSMARNDGINRTVARNQDLETPADVAKVQEHNEREKDSYSNQDIVPERTSLNVHFKAPTDDYVKMFEQMEQDGVISTRGLKPDAIKYGELVFDVNSAYFYNHGGYEFAKQFYADAYKAAVEIVGGEQYILSAVMHADERNRAMSEALGEEVYHYQVEKYGMSKVCIKYRICERTVYRRIKNESNKLKRS